MGKEGELWDDSALVNAFDQAMSKYKIMHNKNHDNATGGVEFKNGTGENVSDIADKTKIVEADDRSNVAYSTTEIEKTNTSLIKENYCVVSSAPEPHADSSNVMHVQDAAEVGAYSNPQGAEDYNQLLNQYHEVEVQRQKILQQLYQLGHWNNDFPVEGSSYGQWVSSSKFQESQVPTSQASHPTTVCSCCPYVSQCVVTPCSLHGCTVTPCSSHGCTVTPCSLHACTIGEACVGKTCTDATAAVGSGMQIASDNADIVKSAMGAAEKAISSMRIKPSEIPGQKEEKDDAKNEGEATLSACSETDLTVVLNAWYSAGFYTGKYLMEQSIAKKRGA